MGAAHTPGPWFLFGNGHCIGGPADCDPPLAAGVATCNMAARSPEENAANAVLIEAAPELLGELEKAHQIIQNALRLMSDEQSNQWAKANDRDGLVESGTTRYHERRAVIAKATRSRS